MLFYKENFVLDYRIKLYIYIGYLHGVYLFIYLFIDKLDY